MFFEEMIFSVSQPVLYIGDMKLNLWFWPIVFSFFKNSLMLLTIILVVSTVLVFYRFQSLRTRIYDAIGEAIESGKLSKEKMFVKWESIKKMSDSNIREDNQNAVIEAENILDEVLKLANYAGENLERRVRNVPDNHLNFKEDIIWAYRIKEQIASGADSDLGKEEMNRAVYIFERSLKELNIL